MTDPALTEAQMQAVRDYEADMLEGKDMFNPARGVRYGFADASPAMRHAFGLAAALLSAPAENERDWNGLAALPNDTLYKALLAGSADADMQKDAADWIERLMRWRDARLSAPAKVGEDGWQPIESAPKDGSEILAYAKDDRNYYGVAEWATKKDFPANSVAGWFWPFAIRPTHWRPIPASPAPQEPQP